MSFAVPKVMTSICHKLQKFIQEQNKSSLPRVAAKCPSNSTVTTGLFLASSLTTADIEVVVQQVLSCTSTALSVTSGKQPWFFFMVFVVVKVGLVVGF